MKTKIEHIGLGVLRFKNAISLNPDIFSHINDLKIKALNAHYTYVYNDDGSIKYATNLSGHRFTPEEVQNNCVRINNFNDLPEGAATEYFIGLEKELYNALLGYISGFPMALPCLWWKTKGHVLSYSSGSALGLHADNDINYMPNYEPDFQLGTKHVLAAIAYLNDDYTGGEINFPYLNLTYQPVAGDILIFPANFVYAHEVGPIKSGDRYAYLAYYGHGSSDPEHGVTITDDAPHIYSGQVWMPNLFQDYKNFIELNNISGPHTHIPLQRQFNSTGTRKELSHGKTSTD